MLIVYKRKQHYYTTKTYKTDTSWPGHVQKYYKHEFILTNEKTKALLILTYTCIRKGILMIHIYHYQIGKKWIGLYYNYD
jgi:hypothetical protein